jgi:hypothetical protein
MSDIVTTEKFLLNEMRPEDRLLFEARLLVEDELKANTVIHRLIHRIVLLYHRKKMKAELDQLHARLLNDPSDSRLRESVLLFKS